MRMDVSNETKILPAARPEPERGAMQRLTRFVLAHRRLVMLAWLALLVAGAVTAGHTSKRLTSDFSLPGQPGYETSRQIVRAYGSGDNQQPIVVSFGPTTPAAAADAFARLQQRVPAVRVMSSRAWTTADRQTAYAIVYSPRERTNAGMGNPYETKIERLLPAVAPPGATGALTSYRALGNGGDSSGPGVLVETIIGAVGALAVLAFVFASLLALVPLLVAAVSILTSFVILLGLTYLTDVSFVVQFLIALIGLGVAVDYSLLIVNRWREERARGRDARSAVAVTMDTAGRAVVLSGGTVAIGLVALVVLPVPFLRSMGLGGALIPLVSVLAAITLLPALLAGFGARADWPRLRREDTASRAWTAWGRRVVGHKAAATGVAGLVLALLLAPVFAMKVGLADTDSLTKSGPAYAAYHRLVDHGVTRGVLTPMEVLVRGDAAPAVAARLAGVPGVASAVAQPAAQNRAGTSLVVVLPDRETVNSASLAPVRAVQTALRGDDRVVGVSGMGPTQIDYVHGVYGNLPKALALIVVLTFALLVPAFRSVLLPLKAVLLNLVSLAATLGAMTAFWQWGWGSQALFGIAPTGAITFWAPMMVFAFLYGLSMDYEVFILARMREEYDRTGSTEEAVVHGIGRTGRLVSSAALILFLACVSLASAPQTDVKILATGLGFGVLLDATVVRSLLVPALVALFGRANWALPAPLARALRPRIASRPTAADSGPA